MEAIYRTTFLLVMMVLALVVSGFIWLARAVDSIIPEPVGRPYDKGW